MERALYLREAMRLHASVVDARGLNIMDATTIITAVILLVILIGWYILLEFDERTHKRTADDRRNHSAGTAQRAKQRQREHDEP